MVAIITGDGGRRWSLAFAPSGDYTDRSERSGPGRPQFAEHRRKLLPTKDWRRGRNSVVECSLPKADVVGSNPIARSFAPSPPDGVFCRLSPPVAGVSATSPASAFPPIPAERSPISADGL